MKKALKSLLPVCACLGLVLFPISAFALDYPWVLLNPEHDSRDKDVIRHDELDSLNMVSVINAKEELFKKRIVWKKVAIKNLLSQNTAFCEMHFDAVKPFWLTTEEKNILREYLQRGGFILFFIDTYPYPQEEFWKIKQWPLMDFLTKELPAINPDFSTEKATDAFPIFKIHYQTETAESIKHELTGNPNTPNRTLLFYQGRLCSFVMGRYYLIEDNAWIAKPRPFDNGFGSELKSYQLIVNIYVYSVVR